MSVWVALALLLGPVPAAVPAALAGHSPQATTVTLVGGLQSELGCAGDWDPGCIQTRLAHDAGDDVWQGTWTVPAGTWEYKVALNGNWDENYGAGAQLDGGNITLTLGAPANVTFLYDHDTHWITSDAESVIAVAPGDFQSELGCPADWQPDCLRSWLQDPDGDDVYTLTTSDIPPGSYEAKVALDQRWDVNYGAGGVQNGANIPFVVSPGDDVAFSYDAVTHVLTITAGSPVQPTSVTIAGSLQSELGCSGDWQPECAATQLTFDAEDRVWQATFALPAGSYEYKAALDGSWDINYGANATPNGANLVLVLPEPATVKFYYSHRTHWITDDRNAVIATLAGSFQSELGCADDWQPACLRAWLQDPDGDGVHTFRTGALAPGSYEVKVAHGESWAVNYGAGGAQDGANIPFTVQAGVPVGFRYDVATHVLTISGQPAPPTGPGHDDDVSWDGLRHDSRDDLYRAPQGAAAAGTPVHLRFRTLHGDVTGVKVRLYDVDAGAQSLVPMTLAAEDVGCYQRALESVSCDLWQATIQRAVPANLWYRFIVTDGSDTDHYADDTSALDGGLGAPSDEVVDQSWALTIYDPAFQRPHWADDAVIYQIFPDRFRNGATANDPLTGDVRYDDPVLALPWGTKPEGYCRNYATSEACPWRYDTTPPDWSPTREQPRGRDYMGGDLQGVIDKLGYLESLGINTIYFNPIFEARSNHRYDTSNYYRIDRYLGTNKTFETLVEKAAQRGIRVVVDGVFNHLSSDSPYFDRYGHYDETGACESASAEHRSWFTFRTPSSSEPAPCVPSTAGESDTYYDGWFGFDSIPVIDKTEAAVRHVFLTRRNSVTRTWLQRGAAGWRMDVMGDASFPAGYWETFRDVVKTTDPQALIISETWQKDSTLLRMIRGDRADTTMNYRLRDAVLGLLAPQPFDPKGFADSGDGLSPREFLARLESIREDYAPQAYYTLMNLLDSHDTERLLWTLTPGSETTAERELDAANVAAGKRRLRLASLVQFTVPGAPTVYYGDEVGVTGDDDPDDRRTYPWADLGGSPDQALFDHYRTLATLRAGNGALTTGRFEALLADDGAESLAYGMFSARQGAIVAINRSGVARTLDIPLRGNAPDGVIFEGRYGVGTPGAVTATVTDGALRVTLEPLSGLLLATGDVDLQGPGAVVGLTVTREGADDVDIDWAAPSGATGYHVYRSVVDGGGWQRLTDDPIVATGFTDVGLEPGRTYFYIVRGVDAAGNLGAVPASVAALPHYAIGWANLQWPPTITHEISVTDCSDDIYGQVWIDGVTSQAGATPGLLAQVGAGPDGSNPIGNAAWGWTDAAFHSDQGNNDQFVTCLRPDATGESDYVYRYSTTGGRDWIYADIAGPVGSAPSDAGDLSVVSSADTTAPPVPQGLEVVSASPEEIALDWDDVSGDATLHGYEVRRGETPGGPYTTLALVTSSAYTDTDVTGGASYVYVVRAVDGSYNRSAHSSEVAATADPRTVQVTFEVTVPDPDSTAGTDDDTRSVHIAGFLDRLDGDLPQWDPAGVVLTKVSDTLWRITLSGLEGTQIEYKYTLGDWEHVEKDAACGERNNRQLTLAYGADGTQTVEDSVANWRNVAPCPG